MPINRKDAHCIVLLKNDLDCGYHSGSYTFLQYDHAFDWMLPFNCTISKWTGHSAATLFDQSFIYRVDSEHHNLLNDTDTQNGGSI